MISMLFCRSKLITRWSKKQQSTLAAKSYWFMIGEKKPVSERLAKKYNKDRTIWHIEMMKHRCVCDVTPLGCVDD